MLVGWLVGFDVGLKFGFHSDFYQKRGTSARFVKIQLQALAAVLLKKLGPLFLILRSLIDVASIDLNLEDPISN